MMDLDKGKHAIAKAHRPFPCSCGGVYRVFKQALCRGPGGLCDLMTYQCQRCGEEKEQTFDLLYLTE